MRRALGAPERLQKARPGELRRAPPTQRPPLGTGGVLGFALRAQRLRRASGAPLTTMLPTKLSVSTSILARRWRFLWAHVPSLDFDLNTHNSDTSFTSIINRVMLFHKVQRINSFRLYYEGLDYSEYDLETWITTVIERNVQNLDLDLHCEIIYVLPRCIFTCNTLVDLRLQYCAIPPPSGALSLPSLKKLYLYYVEYMVDETLPRLLSGSPVLEELIIEKVLDDNLGCFNISSSSLKRLTVNFAFDDEFDNHPDYPVKINAPALRYLEVRDCSYEHISLSPLTSLIEADIYLNSYSMETDYYFDTRCVLKFLDSLCNVKCLNLFGWHEKALQNLDLAVAGSIVKFDNLTKLRLAADWLFLSYFLGNADNLQVLIISEVDSDLQCWMDPHQVPKCLLSHLRTIRIDKVEWTEHAFELIRYLLRNAKVLERMEIYSQTYGTDLKEEFDALKQISSFQRGSEACEIDFHLPVGCKHLDLACDEDGKMSI